MSKKLPAAAAALAVGLGLLAAAGARPRSAAVPDRAATADATADALHKRVRDLEQSLGFVEERLRRDLAEQTLFRRLEDVAVVDVVRYTGPPPRVIKNPTAQGAGNPVIVPAYTFLPR